MSLRTYKKSNELEIFTFKGYLDGPLFFYGRTGAGKSVSLMSIAQSYHDLYGYKIFDLDGGPRAENIYWTLPSNEKLYWSRFRRIGNLDQEGPKQYKVNLYYPFFKSKFPKKLPKKTINDEIIVKSIPFTIPLKKIIKDDIAVVVGNLSESSKYVWDRIIHNSDKKDNSGSLLELCKEIKGSSNTPIYKNFIIPMEREQFIANDYCDYNIDLISEAKDQETIMVLCLDFVPKEFHLFVLNYISRTINELLDINKIPKKNLLLIREAARYFRATDDSVLEDRFKIFRGNMAEYIRMGRRGAFFCLEENTKIKTDHGHIAIKDLEDNFIVKSFDIKNKKFEYNNAYKTFIGEKDCYKIIFDNKDYVIATAEHKFFDKDFNEIEVKNLKAGEEIIKIANFNLTEESKKKISISHIGDNNPSKRLDVKEKIGLASKRNWSDLSYRNRQSEIHKISSKLQWQKDEFRNKMKQSLIKRYEGENGHILRGKQSKNMKDIWKKNKNTDKYNNIIKSLHSKESIQKRKKTLNEHLKDENFRKRYIHSEEIRKKISTNTKLAMQNPEIKLKCAKGGHNQKGIHKPKHTEEAKRKIKLKRLEQKILKRDTKIELKIQKYLTNLNIPFIKHKSIKDIEHFYQCDIFIPSMNLVIECDGDYWHKYPDGREIDKIRTKELIESGFRVIRLWEHEIIDLDIEQFKNILYNIK